MPPPPPSAAIVAVGAAAGAGRLDATEVGAAWGRRGRGTSSVPAPDEDPLTLAWDASVAALDVAGLAPTEVGGLWWGCTRPPFAEGPSHAVLAAALQLPAHVGGALVAGSTSAGPDAMVAAIHALAAGAVDTALVVVSDALVPAAGTGFEARAGAASFAAVLRSEGGARIVHAGTRTSPTLDRYRGDTEATTRDLYDSRLHREAVFVPAIAAGADLVRAVAEPDRWSLPDPDGRLGRVAASTVGAGDGSLASAEVFAALGDTGAPSSLLGALPALTREGTTGILALGAGRLTALVAEATRPVPGADRALAALGRGRPVPYPLVLRARGQLVAGAEPVPMGVPPGSAMLQREALEILGLHGARCDECGTVATPPSVHPSCPGCGGPKLQRVPLARSGTVHTFVVNHTMPAPFHAPLPLVVVDLDDGARVQLQGDGTDELSIGAPVELVLRRYAVERGAPVYGYKVRATTAEDR